MIDAALLLDSRVRLRLLDEEHTDHKLTMNVYLNGLGATDARVWCANCSRTLRARARVERPGDEIEIGIG